MKDWIHFVTLLMTAIVVLIMISTLYGCSTFNVARETAKVVDMIWPEEEKKPEEKKEDDAIIATDLPLSDYENTIACIKVQPECKLDE
tara:strand:- start:163 stop:426 length:264 start_codon:yes stop_codon:yes gene_type:complete